MAIVNTTQLRKRLLATKELSASVKELILSRETGNRGVYDYIEKLWNPIRRHENNGGVSHWDLKNSVLWSY